MREWGHRKQQPDEALIEEMKRRAPKRYEAWLYIKREVEQGRPVPTMKQICAHMGWAWEQSARDVLTALTGYGFLRREWEGRRYRYALNV